MKNDDIKQSLTNEIGEAPASATLSVVTPKGYNTLFTLREMTGTALLEKITALENKLEVLGYKPQVKQVFGAKKEVDYVQLNGNPMLCPMCKVGHVKVIHSAKGTFYGCDQSKFDPMTKAYAGCKYFSNTDPSKVFTPQVVADAIDGWDGIEANKTE